MRVTVRDLGAVAEMRVLCALLHQHTYHECMGRRCASADSATSAAPRVPSGAHAGPRRAAAARRRRRGRRPRRQPRPRGRGHRAGGAAAPLPPRPQKSGGSALPSPSSSVFFLPAAAPPGRAGRRRPRWAPASAAFWRRPRRRRPPPPPPPPHGRPCAAPVPRGASRGWSCLPLAAAPPASPAACRRVGRAVALAGGGGGRAGRHRG